MTAIERARTVAVVGAGTMGQGIAQVALLAGHPVRLFDVDAGRTTSADASVRARVERLVEKGRLERAEADEALQRLHPAHDLRDLSDAALVIEAVVERLPVKQQLFRSLEELVAADCLLATNTSSLSVTAVAGGLEHPGRVVGMHFFNPAPLLPLVEVVSGFATDAAVATRAYDTALAWGKTPVRCADTPGFLVNRLARPFYAEAFAVYEEQAADPATIDAVLRECGGFRMGPFELTDLIGQDVNEAVSRSVWEAFHQSPKFVPSLPQRRLVESGRHGRKSGRGWFSYEEGAVKPQPHTAAPEQAPAQVTVTGDFGPAAEVITMLRETDGIEVKQLASGGPYIGLPGGGQLAPVDGHTSVEYSDVVYFDLALDYRAATRVALAASADVSDGTLKEAVGLFQALGKDVSVIGDVPGMIVGRTVAMLVDLALDAVAKGVATAEDIDTAMRLGVNYPRGPLEWGRDLTGDWSFDLLTAMHERCPTGRYAPSLAHYRQGYAEEAPAPAEDGTSAEAPARGEGGTSAEESTG